MAKELTHRADELKSLGWSQDDLYRYTELWEYRQRWGAINLEREDRQFLRKAEAALPVISKAKASVRKLINEKSYYRWLDFYLEAMNKAEGELNVPDESRGLWAIILEEEIRILDFYEPVLGLPDTIKARSLKPIREELVLNFSKKNHEKVSLFKFDFEKPLKSIDPDQSKNKNWKPLREDVSSEDQNYPVVNGLVAESFRKEVRKLLITAIKDGFPSLSDTDKTAPPEDWNPKLNSVAKKDIS
ncbi:hypothetical protein [Prochlorococcus sp. MIT 1223]|uniref:hypothetical protein n=1 Tax=Prochlorococcus sp. MIT 1223 TaxID=3096217 RepID=UPI002A765359|nr:hypothetical protein [Prochlorococcus sp. MIT 1223]